MINCIIIDDEQDAIDILTHFVKRVPTLQLVGTTTNPLEGLHMLAEQKVDLVFLDIQMPELSGIDFIKAINGSTKVILTTAYSEFALEGFELDVVDYLLKPIPFPRFLSAVQRAIRQVQPMPAETAKEEEEEEYLFVKTESKGKFLKITLADIDYIEGMNNYVAIYQGGRKTLVYTNMKDLEERLPQKKFIRVHRSFIVPITRIAGVEGNQVLLKDVKEAILIGESYKPALMQIIKNKMID